MTREEASNILDDYDVNFYGHDAREIAEAFDVAFKALEQEPCEKCEAGNPCLYCKHDFEKKTEQEPCDKCRYKRTSICGNCKEYDEFEEIDFVQEHKKIPVTLDLTPCTDAVSREDVMQILYDYDCTNENALMVKAIKALPSVNTTQHTSNASKDVEQRANTLGDAVSREAVLQAVSEGCQELRGVYGRCEELINALPSVNPQPCDDAISRDEERYNKGFYDGYTRATEQANAVIEDIKAEIEGLMSHDDYIVDGFNVLDIIDKHIKRRVKNDKR